MAVLTLCGTALLAAIAYLIHCRVWGFAPYLRCDGAGKLHPEGSRTWRTCPRCKGRGSRIWIGRRLINRWSATARRGTK